MAKFQAYFYELPAERIAQRPVYPPHNAKMLIAERKNRTLSSSSFLSLPEYLNEGDLLIFNDTKVIPARFFGRFDSSDAEVEVLLIEESREGTWRCLGRPLKRFRPGRAIDFGDGLQAKVLSRIGDKEVELLFFTASEGKPLITLMQEKGIMPIPPYIRNGRGDDADKRDYQTIFAEKEGSIAAPTASLHFSHEVMQKIKEVGCKSEFLTLHVSTASFLPLGIKDGASFVPPDEEHFSVPESVIDRIKETKARAGRVIGVGTTVVRALESAARGVLSGSTKLFIQPGYKFRMIDALITNFHQPGTTHLLLVEALLGREFLDEAYRYALGNSYRFLSYGDGMLIT
ncbi:MAG: tRNA preQ1(34) S-adenosylmethionine ribosyltransferase-isomerase QueA [SAR324 cluster bacterium]|uniref:S-adenosylmethionine:tRNA ribosyltransferase-isomerase n=1 Tax=SAR324 cluster bacterium TaxID=2024889 RepID=A0A7X9FTE2_9DELT|nr:tRNA preQ1(34) S-adenosylmethionine ribosyltransferase-isomerase QueA [SAR324 cluster bacterium]